MSSREQYKKYNTSLRKAMKTLEERNASLIKGAIKLQGNNYELWIKIHKLSHSLSKRRINKVRLIWFIWGTNLGIAICLIWYLIKKGIL